MEGAGRKYGGGRRRWGARRPVGRSIRASPVAWLHVMLNNLNAHQSIGWRENAKAGWELGQSSNSDNSIFWQFTIAGIEPFRLIFDIFEPLLQEYVRQPEGVMK